MNKNISLFHFKRDILRNVAYKPIIVLSTGRTGTMFMNNLFNKADKLKSYHNPNPELIEQGKIVYETYKQLEYNIPDFIHALSAQTYMAAREERMLECYNNGLKFVETNNRITFFAYAIKHWIKGAKFVFLYRHPGEFVRSGIRREWYSGESPHDIGRLVPVSGEFGFSEWNKWNLLQKISWLWNETNSFILKFLETLDKNDYFCFNFNSLSLETLKELLEFVGGNIDDDALSRLINTPINEQKKGDFPPYEDWNSIDKENMIEITGELAGTLGYKL